jgi:oligoendopeptidase F
MARLADATPQNATELRQWILDWSDYFSEISEESSRRYIAMTCDTQDQQAAALYEQFVSEIDPVVSKWNEVLEKKLVAHPSVGELEEEFGHWFRSVRSSLELFNAKNIPIETQVNLEVQGYQKITSAMSVKWQGETKTLQQMGPFLQSPDRQVREASWKLVTERRLADHEALDASFGKLFALRMQIAANSGYKDNYLPYIFKAKGRFDYTPKDCRKFHETVRKVVLPMQAEHYRRRAGRLGLDRLRPWDTAGDPLGRPPLHPFQTGAELIEKCERLFGRLHPQLGEWFGILRKENLIDAESRLGKAPGGYQIGLDKSRRPFIFMNAAGTNNDVYTLLHEGGHSFHQFAMADQPIAAYRDLPAEFAEVASMGMELLGSADLSDFYSASDARRSRLDELGDLLSLFPWVAMVDEFQAELYSHPGHNASDRREMWLGVMDRFDAGLDWTGFEEAKAYHWQKQLHIFEMPFYYIEYGIAQLGALQVWANAKKDPKKALEKLLAAERLGGSRPVPELFKTAGAKFDFSARTMEPLMRMVCEEFTALEKEEGLDSV